VDRKLPSTAVQGGQDSTRETFYVGRTQYRGEIISGRIQPSEDCCYSSYGGNEVKSADYEVLTNPDGLELDWLTAENGEVPSDAVQGGQTDPNNVPALPLYVGRVRHENILLVGKVFPLHGCLYLGYDGNELQFTQYEVLTCPPFKENLEMVHGCTIMIEGRPTGERFAINLMTGSNDIAFHFNPRFGQQEVIRNSCLYDNWGNEETDGGFPFSRDSPFRIRIRCYPQHYQLKVNNEDFADFKHRFPLECVQSIQISGSVHLTNILV